MRLHNLLIFVGSLFLSVSVATAVEPIRALDSDGVERELNRSGGITVVVYSSPSLQDWTRGIGETLYAVQGHEAFRLVVLVDLRGTLASWAKGMTQRRMSENLDKEAERIRPYFIARGNQDDPRPQLSAIADFHGELSKLLGWDEKRHARRIVVFGKDGQVAARWEDLEDNAVLLRKVRQLLGEAP